MNDAPGLSAPSSGPGSAVPASPRAHRDDLAADTARELALAEVRWSYDGECPPRPRRLAARRAPGGVAVPIRG
ncbi:hypothetical protein [Actinomadura latina]|uniref:Uncharacterized protein n=1 Tax=Actinomadura latina TaxID=163603 RepID=A0A846Z2I1_9ACTN|nr:hypothetical protein [Actinomadura latina]NKZ06451.1 hypothetical protein [Actinomadura latina]